MDIGEKNDTGAIDRHARKMEEIMTRYNIPPDTSFDVIATSSADSHHRDHREFQGKFSSDDQKKFDHEYCEWLEGRRKSRPRRRCQA